MSSCLHHPVIKKSKEYLQLLSCTSQQRTIHMRSLLATPAASLSLNLNVVLDLTLTLSSYSIIAHHPPPIGSTQASFTFAFALDFGFGFHFSSVPFLPIYFSISISTHLLDTHAMQPPLCPPSLPHLPHASTRTSNSNHAHPLTHALTYFVRIRLFNFSRFGRQTFIVHHRSAVSG
ncbi:hypothetical protein BDZ97DRAFT_741584 [Flammula alnicola]|nr:hypothetical protein BDZ97DRAFT_741584 [Flammula alnicola]